MDDPLFRELQTTRDPAEKAAIIAEILLKKLPENVALVTRYCVILHWFNQQVVESLLHETRLTKKESKELYYQIGSLPFVERLNWGIAIQDLTRAGLLQRYIRTQPEILRTAARLAAPAYVGYKEKKFAAEALFCYIVAGNREISEVLLHELLEGANAALDWQYIERLLRLQDEAENLPFVQMLARTEQQWILRGLLHRLEEDSESAIADYNTAITMNPGNVLAYLSRGATYAELGHYDRALEDFTGAIRLDPDAIQAYINRGMIYVEQQRLEESLADFSFALELEPDNSSAHLNRDAVLKVLGRDGLALADYEQHPSHERNPLQRKMLSIPPATLVIDTRGITDNLLATLQTQLDTLQIELQNVANDTHQMSMNHLRDFTSFIGHKVIDPLKATMVEELLRNDTITDSSPYANLEPTHQAKIFTGPSDPNMARSYSSQEETQNPLQHYAFDYNLQTCIGEIDALRNRRINAMSDLDATGAFGRHYRDPMVRVIFLTDAKRPDSLSTTAVYAEYLKRYYSKIEWNDHPSAVNTTVVCFSNTNLGNPIETLMNRLSRQREDNKWAHIDSLILSEEYNQDAGSVGEDIQPILAELLLYIILLTPPLTYRTDPLDNEEQLINPAPEKLRIRPLQLVG